MSDFMTKVTIITRREKFEVLRKELVQIGVTGMTVTKVEGFGAQHGIQKVIEGMNRRGILAQKVKVEIVVCTVPVEQVIECAKNVLYTGNIGDGKIFTSKIDRVVRIRTGELDKEALSD